MPVSTLPSIQDSNDRPHLLPWAIHIENTVFARGIALKRFSSIVDPPGQYAESPRFFHEAPKNLIPLISAVNFILLILDSDDF